MKEKIKNVPFGPVLFGITTFFSLGPFLFAKNCFLSRKETVQYEKRRKTVKKKFVLVDGNSIMNRAFYGIMGSKMLITKMENIQMQYMDF